MSRDPVDIAIEWAGLRPLGPVWQELARRMGASDRSIKTITVTGLDDLGRRTLASLLGLQRVPEHSAVPVDAGKLGRALGLVDDVQLRRLVERIQGPIDNRAALRATTMEARARLWSLMQQRIGARIPATLERIRAAGVPGGDVDAHARTLELLANCLDCLPSPSPVPLPMLAWQVSRDPHALDGNTTCGRYLQLAAVELAGNSTAEPDGTAIRRGLQALGVVIDRLSSATTTYGLRAELDSPVGRLLEAIAELKTPIGISGTMLDASVPRFLQRRWLCVENPSIVEAAVLTGYAGPLVCTSGWPSTDTQRLLHIACEQGVELYYAGDYDSVGLAIAKFMATRYGAHIVMTKAMYLAADVDGAREWGSEGIPETPWDVELSQVIRTKRRIVYQEDPMVWRGLLELHGLNTPNATSGN